MLVSKSHDFLYIHVPRTGGTSIREALNPFSTRPSKSRFNKVISGLGLRPWAHRHFPVHPSFESARSILPGTVFSSLFKFSFVRNPWARLASDYVYKRENRDHRRHAETCRLGGFEAWLRQEAGRKRSSQLAMLGQDIDFLGRFENLQLDFETVCSRLGLGASLEHLNSAQKTPWEWRELYNSTCQQLVFDYWGKEIEDFDYAFES